MARGKRAVIGALVVAAVIGAGALADWLFHLRPIAAEKFWIAALDFAPLREEASFRLRNYPTRAAAVALVSHVRNGVRRGDLKEAARATETLCILSGRSFGTAFQEHARGHFWSAPEPGQWVEVLARVDEWAERSFGAAR